MRLEDMSGKVEQESIKERGIGSLKDAESERPSEMELPQLENKQNIDFETAKWEPHDAERESEELPHIEVKEDLDGFYSTREERIQQTPREDSERGTWDTERGESNFTPNDKEIQDILEKYGKNDITYKDGIPDFSEVSEATVEIDNMTEKRADNFRQCDEKCADMWNQERRDGRTDWAARDIKEWRQENGYSWHERNDMKTCDLVPTKVNDYFGHLGGVSECRKRDAEMQGGRDFDE